MCNLIHNNNDNIYYETYSEHSKNATSDLYYEKLDTKKKICIPDDLTNIIIELTKQIDKPDLLEWVQKHFECGECVAIHAALNGYISIIKWWSINKNYRNSTVSYYAAMGGHSIIFEFLKKNGYQLCTSDCATAAEHGHLELLKWLWSNRCPWNSRAVSRLAFESGFLEIVDWNDQVNFPQEDNLSENRGCSIFGNG